jgi:high affinity sulfate transporter 1
MNWREYRPAWLRSDAVAGVTVWAVLVPQSLAFATIAGVAPVVGLYAAVPSLILYAFIGTSRHLIVGPMPATAALSAAIVAAYAQAGTDRYAALTAALAICTGVASLIAGLLRLGFVAALFCQPVLQGFIVGLALTILMGQLPSLFGVEKGSGDLFQQTRSWLAHLGQTNVPSVIIGILCLSIVLGLRRRLPRAPGSLVAVIVAILATYAFDLDRHGVAIVGPFPTGRPHLGLPPAPAAKDYLSLAGPAIGVVLVGFAQGLGAAKTYAARAGYTIAPNRELLGMGAANISAGLASGMVVNGSRSTTAVNGGAGARTQVSGLTCASLTIITLLYLTGLFEKLPEPTLAAIVIAAVIELVDRAALRRLYRVYTRGLGTIYGPAARADFAGAIVAMLGVVAFGALPGLVIGIGVSILLLLYRTSRPHVATLGRHEHTWVDLDRHPDARPAPGVTVLRVESGLHFANADAIRTALQRAAIGHHAVVLDGQTTPSVDVTATVMLLQLSTSLRRSGVRFAVARDIGQVRDVVERDLETHSTVDNAVEALTARPVRP